MMRARGNAGPQITIDGQELKVQPDATVLEVARQNELDIPTLCHLKGLSDVGACRMCLVEVKGNTRLQPACVTKVQDGMEVTTKSERLLKYRRMILELLFAERNHICAVCVASGNCELQALAANHGMDHVRFAYRFPSEHVDLSHARFAVDHNRCILCTRCVRVCDEIEGAHTWDVMGRGINSKVITDLNQPWGESLTCTNCSKCVQVCPTGALFEKGQAVSEAEKRPGLVPRLVEMREAL